MATQAATPESVSTPTHCPPGRHTWFHLEAAVGTGLGRCWLAGRGRCWLAGTPRGSSPAREGRGDDGSHHPVAQS
eukprot:4970335-Pleurochrysis_carterae.AAC.2